MEDQPTNSRNSPEKGYVLDTINSFLKDITESIRCHSPIEVVLVNRSSRNKTSTLSFPGRLAAQAGKFAAFIKLLEIVHGCVSEERLMTKRDIYYQNVNVFRKQSTVDRLVDDLAATLKVKRSSLNVVAAGKGLVYGHLVVHMGNDETIDCRNNIAGTVIPLSLSIRRLDLADTVRVILVVEKEAVFRTLLDTTTESFKSQFIILTGKGYPDISTREFLVLLAERSELPIYCIMDFDPHGFDIAAVYKYGSASLQHEGTSLTTPRMNHLGVTATDLKDMINHHQVYGVEEGLLHLCNGDRKKTTALLKGIHGPIKYCRFEPPVPLVMIWV